MDEMKTQLKSMPLSAYIMTDSQISTFVDQQISSKADVADMKYGYARLSATSPLSVLAVNGAVNLI